MEQKPSLSRSEVSHALRAFILASGLWGAWGRMVGIGTAVFTGYALSLGADASEIAFLTAVAYLLAPTQILSPLISRWVANKKRLVVSAGSFEVLFRGLLAVIPFVFALSLRLEALLIFLILGLIFSYLLSPFYSSWLASTIPANIWARFTGRQTTVRTLVAMITGFLVGRFIDGFGEANKQTGFIVVFIVGTLLGWAGYYVISRAPFPRLEEQPGSGNLQNLLQPFKDVNFRCGVLFFAAWSFARGLSGPLYSVFMLERLRLSYTTIAIFSALSMAATILGYRVWSELVDRFGSKPVLQIILVPVSLIPVLWVFNRPDAYYLVPVAMVLGGFFFAGILVAIRPLLYSFLPQGDQKVAYLASWSASVNLIYAFGPLLGGFLVRSLEGMEVVVGHTSIGNIQVVFLLSALARLIPIFLLRFVVESRAIPSRYLLSQIFRGNVLSYAYHNVIYSLATEEDRRARAAWALGKSGNPLAIEQLVQALKDASPKVRSQAARALGETGSEAAADSLIKELINGASDIRSEAAEALGRLKHPRGIDPLIAALEDADPRVRSSAIRGLAEIGGEDVQELLYWHFSDSFDPLTFPTLVDVLSNMQDQRIVKPALQYLNKFPSSAIRLQLLNSVCRTLGADGQFYRLLSQEDNKRYAELGRLLQRATATLTKTNALNSETHKTIESQFRDLIRAYENDQFKAMTERLREVTNLIRDGLLVGDQRAYQALSIYMIIVAINTFLASDAHRDLADAREIFLVVCLSRMADLLRD